MIYNIFQLYVSLSFSGTIIIFFIYLIRFLLKDKLSKHWNYYIWFIVILRLVIPFSIEKNIINYIVNQIKTKQTAASNIQLEESNWMPALLEELEENVQLEQPNKSLSEEQIIKNPKKSKWFSQKLGYIWILIAFLLFIKKIVSYQVSLFFIKSHIKKIHQPQLLTIFSSICREMNIKRTITFCYKENLPSPVFIGCYHPYIVLNELTLSEKEVYYTIRHELTHYKRKDNYYKWLMQAVVCLHWFNPFVWIMLKTYHKDCELSCDESVIHSLDTEGKRVYGNTLLNALKRSNTNKTVSGTIFLTEKGSLLKERLGAIMKYKKKPKSIVIVTAIFTCLIGFSTIILGSYIQYPKSVLAEQQKKALWKQEQMVQKTSKTKETTQNFTYRQRSYYIDSYIIQLGWNIDNNSKTYPNTAKITGLSKTYTVSFDKKAKQYAADSSVLSALSKLIKNIEKKNRNPKLETPLVVSVEGPYHESAEQLAQRFYNNPSYFSAVYPVLNKTLKKEYAEKMYKDGEIAAFSACLPNMSNDIITKYFKKARKDEATNFSSVLASYISEDTIEGSIKDTSIDDYKDRKMIDLASIKSFRVTAGSGPEQAYDYSKLKQTDFIFSQGQKLQVDVDWISAFHSSTSGHSVKLIFVDSQQHTVKVILNEGKKSEVIFENAGVYSLSIQNDGIYSLGYSFIFK